MKSRVLDGKETGKYLDGTVGIAIEFGVPWPPFDTPLRVVVEWDSDYDDYPEVQVIRAELAEAQAELKAVVYGDYPLLEPDTVLKAAQRCRSLDNAYYRAVGRLADADDGR